MRFLLLLAIVTVAFCADSGPDQVEWNGYKRNYKKKYSGHNEEKFRQKVYFRNKKRIVDHNKRYDMGQVSYQLGINKFADLAPDEFVRTMNGYKHTNLTKSSNVERKPFPQPPGHPSNSIDWREIGAITPVKDQGPCGSCWAFSATGALEAQNFIQTGQLVTLSEQNLIDCSHEYGNFGCDGGSIVQSFQYIQDNDGININPPYPYEATMGTCRYDAAHVGATVSGFIELPSGSESALKLAIAMIGPVSVAMDASQDSFQFYSGGLYYEPLCGNTPDDLDHAVLAVGYGTTENGEDYWLLKNSWGTSWGDQGFMLIPRNEDNMCGIATAATVPLI